MKFFVVSGVFVICIGMCLRREGMTEANRELAVYEKMRDEHNRKVRLAPRYQRGTIGPEGDFAPYGEAEMPPGVHADLLYNKVKVMNQESKVNEAKSRSKMGTHLAETGAMVALGAIVYSLVNKLLPATKSQVGVKGNDIDSIADGGRGNDQVPKTA